MYSEALTIMDRNTALYMCEEQKKEIEELRSAIMEKDSLIAALQEKLHRSDPSHDTDP